MISAVIKQKFELQSAISKLTAIGSPISYWLPSTVISIISYLRIIHIGVPSLAVTTG